jgi:hypothetical protein
MRGSSASRRPSPRRLTASTVTERNGAGKKGCGARSRRSTKLATVVTRSCRELIVDCTVSFIRCRERAGSKRRKHRAPHGCTNCKSRFPTAHKPQKISHGSCVIRSIAGHRARLVIRIGARRGGPKSRRSREHVAPREQQGTPCLPRSAHHAA